MIKEDFIPGNKTRDFDLLTKKKLGVYVYALIDPLDRSVIYIGKGGGDTGGVGNERIFSHFEEAEKKPQDKSEKLERIRAVWRRLQDVEWVIVRHGLSSAEEALKIEQALIDLLNISKNGKTSNLVLGHGAKEYGLLKPVDIVKFAAPLVDPDKAVAVHVFSINKEIEKRGGIGMLTDKEIYEATRKSWSISTKEYDGIEAIYAVGVVDCFSLGAYKVDRWERIEEDSKIGQPKHGFIGSVDDFCSQLKHKDWRSLLEVVKPWRQKAGGKAIPFVMFDGLGKFKHIKGKDNNWYALQQNP